MIINRQLLFTQEAQTQLERLSKDASKKNIYKQILKTLGFLEINTKHPSLKTHEYTSIKGINGEKIWEAYVQNNTAGAYRVFFHYGPDMIEKGKKIPTLTIVTITPHP